MCSSTSSAIQNELQTDLIAALLYRLGYIDLAYYKSLKISLEKCRLIDLGYNT